MRQRTLAEQRRQRWKRFEQRKKRSGTIDYERWDAWEPDEDEDELGDPDPNDPRFAALERDFKEREKKRLEKRRRSEDLKKEGNACFARQEYHNAIEWYTKALDERKDAKEIYANRALAHLRCQHAFEALADCDSGLEIAEFFEGGRCSLNNSVLYKLWMRRASANLLLRRPRDAEADLRDGALKCVPSDKDALSLLQKCERVKGDLELARLSKQKEKSGDATIKSLSVSLHERDWRAVLRIVQQTPSDEILELLRAKGAVQALKESVGTDAVAVDVLNEFLKLPANVEEAVGAGITSSLLDAIEAAPLSSNSMLLSCLQRITHCKAGRRLLSDGSCGHRTLRLLLQRLDRDRVPAAAAVIGNLAVEGRFRALLRDVERPLVVERLMQAADNVDDELKGSCCGALANVLLDRKIRLDFIRVGDVKALVGFAKSPKDDIAVPALGVLVNLAVEPSALPVLLHADAVSAGCYVIDTNTTNIELRSRALTLLSRLAVDPVVQKQIGEGRCLGNLLGEAEKVLEGTNNNLDAVADSTIRTLALCASWASVEHTRGRFRSVTLAMMRWPSQNVRANAALCVSRLADCANGKQELDALSPAIEGLVQLMKDGDKAGGSTAQKNAAIACAKLARFPPNLEKLRRLHAVEMMISRASNLLP